MKAPKLAAIYARTSVEDVGNPDSRKQSIDQQVSDARAKAIQLGYTVQDAHVYIDRDLTGKLPPTCWLNGKGKSRPAFSAMIQAIESGTIQAVIFYKQDRIARNLLIGIRFFQLAMDKNVEVYATGENLSCSNDASGRFALTVQLAASQMELEKIQERARASHKYRKSQGIKTTPVYAFGYQDGKVGEVIVDEQAKPLVKVIFQKVIDGGSLNGLVNWLNDKHPIQSFTSYARAGRTWHRNTINCMIRNPHYKGNKLYPQLIDERTWNEANQAVNSRKYTRHTTHEVHLMSGFMHCYQCGTGLKLARQHNANDKHLCYRCITRAKDHKQPPPLQIMEAEWIRFADEFLSRCKAVNGINEKSTAINLDIAKQEAKLAELQEEYRKDELNIKEYKALAEPIKAAVKVLEAALGKTTAIVKSLKDWPQMSNQEKRIMLGQTVNDIKCYPDGVLVDFKHVEFTDGGKVTHIQSGQLAWFPVVRVPSKKVNGVQYYRKALVGKEWLMWKWVNIPYADGLIISPDWSLV